MLLIVRHEADDIINNILEYAISRNLTLLYAFDGKNIGMYFETVTKYNFLRFFFVGLIGYFTCPCIVEVNFWNFTAIVEILQSIEWSGNHLLVSRVPQMHKN